MALTKVTSGVRTLGTGEVATANMAVDPTNASNLSSGSVPLAQLGNVDTTGLEDDIALLGFKVASNGSLAKYNLVDQTVDDFQDTSGVDASASTNEVRDASGKYYSGQVVGVASSSVHTAVGAATWTCPTDVTSADILVVAGGAGGAGADTINQSGGGGGGGGIVHHATYTTVPAVVYDLTVGDKGVKGGSVDPRSGTNGGNSSFNDNAEGSQSKMTAVGGGYGGGGGSAVGGDGGSGGGGGHNNAGGSGTQADSSGGTGYGNDGGDGYDGTGAGAGGGAGAVGAAGSSGTGGAGGAGKLFSNFTSYGASGYFGGGGGAGGGTTGGAAGSGGGGAGGTGGSGMTAGTVNTGGGGGGGGDVSTGADGGTGTVIILYTPMGFNNMTLVSATTAAQAAPTKGDIVLTYTNGAGTTTLDTDLTAEISADGGSTWTALALGSEGSTGSHNIATSHDVTISSTITAPYNMAYRIKTLNQSVSKTTRIQAVSLGWS